MLFVISFASKTFGMKQEVIELGAVLWNIKDLSSHGKTEKIVEGLLEHYKRRINKVLK